MFLYIHMLRVKIQFRYAFSLFTLVDEELWGRHYPTALVVLSLNMCSWQKLAGGFVSITCTVNLTRIQIFLVEILQLFLFISCFLKYSASKPGIANALENWKYRLETKRLLWSKILALLRLIGRFQRTKKGWPAGRRREHMEMEWKGKVCTSSSVSFFFPNPKSTSMGQLMIHVTNLTAKVQPHEKGQIWCLQDI